MCNNDQTNCMVLENTPQSNDQTNCTVLESEGGFNDQTTICDVATNSDHNLQSQLSCTNDQTNCTVLPVTSCTCTNDYPNCAVIQISTQITHHLLKRIIPGALVLTTEPTPLGVYFSQTP